jgi:hypothetical protein
MKNNSDLFEHLKTYVPMHRQAATYSCLIDVRGIGVSGRLPYILSLGRPVLFVNRPRLWTWFTDPRFDDPLLPWVHVVPVADDLLNLEARAGWVLNETFSATDMARRAVLYARRNFARGAMHRYLFKQLFRGRHTGQQQAARIASAKPGM